MVARPKILIVEDENIVQFHLRITVQELGYTVSGVATTAAEAMLRAQEDPPHLVLMDIGLPGASDGIEAARALKAQFDLDVVFLTAYGDEETVGRAQEIGAVGYLVKPFTRPQLRAALSTAVAGQRNLRRAKQNEFSLVSALAGTGEAIIITDLTGLVTFMNTQAVALTGWSQGEACDRHVLDVVRIAGTPEPPGESAMAVNILPLGEEGAIGGIDLHARDGSPRRVEGEIKPLRDTDGTKRGAVIVFREAARPAVAVPRAAIRARPFGEATRMVFFSHDTLGLGHLQRSLNLARALTRRYPELSILLLTGSSAVHRYSMPERVDYVKLPSVRKVGVDRYQARSLGLSDEGIRELRSNLALRSIQGFDPHVLLVDHAPVGMGGELRPALDWLREHRPHCINLYGMRDVVDDPAAVVALWTERGTYDVLRDLYDHILIYGSPDVLDVVSAYGFPDALRAKAEYCNYVQEQPSEARERIVVPPNTGIPLVTVTIGGGDGAGELVLGTWLEMLRRYRDEVNFESLLLPGPFLPDELRQKYHREAEDLPVTMIDFVPTTTPYLERADLIVCTCGYNTMVQTLGFGKKALVIPRLMHRQEQLIRAKALEAMDILALLHPHDVTVERLFAAVRAQLDDPRARLVEAREQSRMCFDGADRIADFCGRLSVVDSPVSGPTPS